MREKLQALIDRALPVLQQNGVIRASVFGSFARGDEGQDSDLDLLVEFERSRTLLDLVSLSHELPEVVGLPVDVVTYDSIVPAMRAKILSEQVVIL